MKELLTVGMAGDTELAADWGLLRQDAWLGVQRTVHERARSDHRKSGEQAPEPQEDEIPGLVPVAARPLQIRESWNFCSSSSGRDEHRYEDRRYHLQSSRNPSHDP